MINQTKLFGIPLQHRRQRRLLVIGYYLLVSAYPLIAFFKGHSIVNGGGGSLIYPTFFLAGLLGGIRSGGPVKLYEGPDRDPNGDPTLTLNLSGRDRKPQSRLLDERETAQRDHAHYRAYVVLRWVLVVAVIAYSLPSLPLSTWLAHWTALLLWILMMLTLSLPQAILLWTEPDSISDGHLSIVSPANAD